MLALRAPDARRRVIKQIRTFADMLLLIDNYDSFTYNLVHYLGELGAKSQVVRNDDMQASEALAMAPEAIVLSPGPCTPNEAGICVELVREAPATLPILGVCLGHQSIAAAFGARVESCQEILHGKLSVIDHNGEGVFKDLPQEFQATRYHSLSVARESLPDTLEATAGSRSGVIMGLRHKTRPVHGVQFHPESIATEHGHKILGNFLALAGLEKTT